MTADCTMAVGGKSISNRLSAIEIETDVWFIFSEWAARVSESSGLIRVGKAKEST